LANAEAGCALALEACTGCHLLVPGQAFKSFYGASPRSPDFKDIGKQTQCNGGFVETFSGVLAGVPERNENSEIRI
jgi:hypothetical protein